MWSPHFVTYGAVPATLVPAPGTTTTVWVNWLNDAENAQMNGTEGTGSLYALGRLRDVDLQTPGPPVTDPTAYVDCYGALSIDGTVQSVREVDTEGRTSNPIDEPTVLRALLPTLDWTESVFDLVLDNVTSTSGRDQRTAAIAPLGVQVPDEHFDASVPCSSNPHGEGGSEF